MKEEEFLAEIGRRIKKQRKAANLSQQQLASMCDFEKSNMSRLESGKSNPTLITLRKVCLALNTNVCTICEDMF